MPTNKEQAEREIIDKIRLTVGGITHESPRDRDLMIAQTVQALAAAYKDLRNTPEIMEDDTDGQPYQPQDPTRNRLFQPKGPEEI